MQAKLIEQLNQKQAEAASLWGSLRTKTAEGESLRLIDFDLNESQYVFQRIACCYLHLGLPRDRFKEIVFKIRNCA